MLLIVNTNPSHRGKNILYITSINYMYCDKNIYAYSVVGSQQSQAIPQQQIQIPVQLGPDGQLVSSKNNTDYSNGDFKIVVSPFQPDLFC